ncbi:MAG: tRNA (N6-isopentenyl adenosine(37)-C2)-methylthiotransferase MiaB [Pseudomonadota bacterium]
MKKTYHLKTYGCQMNVYDSARMTEILAAQGYHETADPAAATLIILNTCHIREKAVEKVYSDIGRLRRLPAPDASMGERLIAVAGCVAQAEGAEILARAPAVNLVFGPQAYHRLPDMLTAAEDQRRQGRAPRVLDTDFPAESKFDHLPQIARPVGPTAFLTIQEGCDKFCTFCVVPYTRGAETSRPVAAIEAEARALAARGARDITLLGQNVNAYHGVDEKGGALNLAGLIRRLAGIEGVARLRYTTSHPRDMDDALIAVHAEVEQCMPYLHLPVQSGSDRVLAAMNRRHRVADYLAIIAKLRRARPDIALSSDIIVGFPGETEADFAATLALVEDVGYAQCYSFKYSPRPGTPAAEMTGQVDEEVKAERLHRLQALLGVQQRAFNQASIGRTLPVLIEKRGRKAGQWVGRSPYMQAVHMDGTAGMAYADRIGDMVAVRIVAAGANSLAGEMLSGDLTVDGKNAAPSLASAGSA